MYREGIMEAKECKEMIAPSAKRWERTDTVGYKMKKRRKINSMLEQRRNNGRGGQNADLFQACRCRGEVWHS